MQIYVLRLTGGKYYVGKTHDVMTRYQQHLDGRGSAWTRMYRPIGVVKILQTESPFEEDKITKEYMAKYGIQNVRGGSYCEVVLDRSQQEALQRELWSAMDRCSRCGRTGHFVKDCYAGTDVDGLQLYGASDSESDSDEWESDSDSDSELDSDSYF